MTTIDRTKLESMGLSQLNVIERNIRNAIKAMKRDGTTCCSLGCLFQNTSTTGLGLRCHPNYYRSVFAERAKIVAFGLRFEVYGELD